MIVLLLLGAGLVLGDATDLNLGGLALVGGLLFGLGCYAHGMFTAEFWMCDAEDSARCSAIDRDLDRLEGKR